MQPEDIENRFAFTLPPRRKSAMSTPASGRTAANWLTCSTRNCPTAAKRSSPLPSSKKSCSGATQPWPAKENEWPADTRKTTNMYGAR